MRCVRILLYLSAFLVGLHVPRSNSIMFIFALVLIFLSIKKKSFIFSRYALEYFLVLFFSILYLLFSWTHGLWAFNLLDISEALSFLCLPFLLYLAGVVASSHDSRLIRDILILYFTGSSLFFLLSLILTLHSSSEYHNASQLLVAMRVPWGSVGIVNVRSIEQNISIAASLFLPLLIYTSRPPFPWRSTPLLVLGLFCILSAVSLRSRFVGFSCLGTLVFFLLIHRRSDLFPSSKILTAFVKLKKLPLILLSALVLSLSLFIGSGPVFQRLLSRVYDERLDRALGLFQMFPNILFGGQSISFSFFDLQRQSYSVFDASRGDLMHNVFLDVMVRVGVLPALLLFIFVIINFKNSLPPLLAGPWNDHPENMQLIFVSFFTVISLQWFFQPLVYSDQSFFYFSFFVLGSMSCKLNKSKSPHCPSAICDS